jgi:hypothetical protein
MLIMSHWYKKWASDVKYELLMDIVTGKDIHVPDLGWGRHPVEENVPDIADVVNG